MTDLTAAAHDAHVVAFAIVQEATDYRANVRTSSDCDDFGDQCYYSDRASDNLDRLREMGAHAMVYVLTH